MLLTKSISFHVSATINVTVGDFSKNVWANVDTLKANLDGLLSTAIIRGDNLRELIKYLKPLVKETVLNKRYAAERIARTESARVQYKAQLDSLKTNDYKYCKWYIEPGACKACREIAISNSGGNLLEGIYEVDDCPDIPVHPNCRCSIGAWWKDETSYSKYDKVITDDDIQALNNYISSDSYRINEKLRLNIWDNDLQEKVHNLDSALSKMPIYDGKEPLQRDLFFMDYEKMDKFIKELSKGRFFVDKAYLSASKDHYGEGTEQVHMIIKHCKSARDVSKYNYNEQEVIFPRNTKFRIVKTYEQNGIMTVVMLEE